MIRSFALIIMLLSSGAYADWSLVNSESNLKFLTTKKNNVTELSHFKSLSGTLTIDGKATLSIDLSSVDTLIPIRNERMKKVLFNTEKHPTADILVGIDAKALKALKPGELTSVTTKAKITLNGITKTLDVGLEVFKDSKGKITAISSHPILINAVSFSLSSGIDELMKLAKLPSISYMVPVTFKLVYAK